MRLPFFPEAASSYAHDIDNLIWLILISVGFWGGLTAATFFYFLWKYRAKEGVKALYVTGKDPKHKRWVTIPHWLIIVCDVFIIVGAIYVWHKVKQDLPEPEQTVRIIGAQWTWKFVHPGPDGVLDTDDDIRTTDELHVMVDTVTHFQLESEDVLHSFSVPVFRLKQDAIPGRRITGWFEPTRTGDYDFQCAEMCGIGHGLMAARVYVETPEEHGAWMASAPRY